MQFNAGASRDPFRKAGTSYVRQGDKKPHCVSVCRRAIRCEPTIARSSLAPQDGVDIPIRRCRFSDHVPVLVDPQRFAEHSIGQRASGARGAPPSIRPRVEKPRLSQMSRVAPVVGMPLRSEYVSVLKQGCAYIRASASASPGCSSSMPCCTSRKSLRTSGAKRSTSGCMLSLVDVLTFST